LQAGFKFFWLYQYDEGEKRTIENGGNFVVVPWRLRKAEPHGLPHRLPFIRIVIASRASGVAFPVRPQGR
jgi:hypothetical protein